MLQSFRVDHPWPAVNPACAPGPLYAFFFIALMGSNLCPLRAPLGLLSSGFILSPARGPAQLPVRQSGKHPSSLTFCPGGRRHRRHRHGQSCKSGPQARVRSGDERPCPDFGQNACSEPLNRFASDRARAPIIGCGGRTRRWIADIAQVELTLAPSGRSFGLFEILGQKLCPTIGLFRKGLVPDEAGPDIGPIVAFAPTCRALKMDWNAMVTAPSPTSRTGALLFAGPNAEHWGFHIMTVRFPSSVSGYGTMGGTPLSPGRPHSADDRDASAACRRPLTCQNLLDLRREAVRAGIAGGPSMSSSGALDGAAHFKSRICGLY